MNNNVSWLKLNPSGYFSKKLTLLLLLAALSFLLGNIYASFAYNKLFHDMRLYQANSSVYLLRLVTNNETDKAISILETNAKTQLGFYSHIEYETQDSLIAYGKNFLVPNFYIHPGISEEDKTEISKNIAKYLSKNPIEHKAFFDCSDLTTPKGIKSCEIYEFWEDIHSDIKRFVNENDI